MSILKRDELSIIFKYLNGVDLHNASQVCSFWLEIAIEENNRRKPTWVTKKELVKCLRDWKTIKTQFIDHCRTKPSLHLMFHGCQLPKDYPEGCYCQYLPYNCASITVKHFYKLFTKNTISNIFFPEIPNIKITTITLHSVPWNKGVYCEELKWLFDKSFSNTDKLKTIFEPFTGNDIPMSSCVVFIYNIFMSQTAIDLAHCLEKWFPNKKMSMLAIGTDSISFCKSNYISHVCQQNADCIAILLNGTNMESWTQEVKSDYSLIDLKNKASLKNNSVCFKARTGSVFEFFYYENNEQFQNFFPNVPIFNLPCIGSVASNKIEEICNRIGTSGMGENTGFLLLTYD